MDNEVYWRIYYLRRADYVTVVCMQYFDEYDYTEEHFYRDGNGEKYKFSTEEEAIEFLNENFKTEFIDPEYKRDANLFGHMLK